ncbi:MAG TPA: PAS domain-containing protein, partial [Candidatus Polarisedimenticolaceae bacterium]|nr:PAS domain-containing protein [Candidatus Polarisedimenticolaceae bacterium]
MQRMPAGSAETDSLRSVLPDLSELCRIYDISLELIERSHDLDDLLDRILDEYEQRLAELPLDAFDAAPTAGAEGARKLRALVMFARQAAALKEKAAVFEQETRSRRALADVLEALDAGIVLVGVDGRVTQANRAASTLLEIAPAELV